MIPSKPKLRFGWTRTTPGGGLRRSGPGESKRLEIRLLVPQHLVAKIDQEAAYLEMSRRQWVFALVRRRLIGKPALPRREELTLFEMHAELRRARIELTMIRRALIEAGGQIPPSDLLAAIAAHAAAQETAMGAIRDAFEGNLAYWTTAR